MILTGNEIKARLGGDILIDPFNEAQLNPNSYNLRLHDELLVYEEIVLDMRRPNRYRRYTIPPEGFVLHPNQLYLGRTVERTETHNAAGLMRRAIYQGFCRAALVGDEAELAQFLTYGFAELAFQVRPARQDLVLSLFKVLTEVFRNLKIPVVVAFDQLEDLLLARRSDDAHKIAEAFFAGIVQAMHQLDGAALVLVGSEQAGKDLGLTPRARVVATATSGADSTIMLTGPTPAAHKVLAAAGLTVDDIDLFEINEAFASVVLKFQKDLNIPDEKLNVNGGAIAMGHPLGATGAMITGTMAMKTTTRPEPTVCSA